MHGKVFFCPECGGFAVCNRIEWVYPEPLLHLSCGHAVPMKGAETPEQHSARMAKEQPAPPAEEPKRRKRK